MGFERARKVFTAAWQRLAGTARAKAEAEVRDELSEAFAQVRKADDIIVEAAGFLPVPVRRKLAEVRTGLAARIIAIRAQIAGGGKGRTAAGKDQEGGK